MIEISLGDRYAKSILELATERGEVDKVQKDFILIESVCKSSPDFARMLKSPLIRADKKQAIIDEVFGGKLSEITKNLVQIVVRKKREMYLYDIAVRYLALYDAKMNITRGVLISATKMSGQQIDAIKKIVEKEFSTTFEMEEAVDPALIGGFRLRIGDRLFDGSVSTKLRELKQEFENNPYVKQV
ncbi:MAG: ATP synthase F1 subunit delta [Bacteroidota bacterium]